MKPGAFYAEPADYEIGRAREMGWTSSSAMPLSSYVRIYRAWFALWSLGATSPSRRRSFLIAEVAEQADGEKADVQRSLKLDTRVEWADLSYARTHWGFTEPARPGSTKVYRITP